MKFQVFEMRPKIAKALNCSRLIFERYKKISKADREMMMVICMDTKNNVRDEVVISLGTAANASASPREIFKSAISVSAVGIVVVHNHPSGDPEPSMEDRQLTRQLVTVGRVVDILVIDHVIIGDGTYFSFGDMGLIAEYEENAKTKFLSLGMPI